MQLRAIAGLIGVLLVGVAFFFYQKFTASKITPNPIMLTSSNSSLKRWQVWMSDGDKSITVGVNEHGFPRISLILDADGNVAVLEDQKTGLPKIVYQKISESP